MDQKTNNTLFVTKQLVNIVPVGQKTLTAIISSTTPQGNQTILSLANGLTIATNNTSINAGQSINATVEIIEPQCAFAIMNQTKQPIGNLTDILTSEPHVFKELPNPECENGTRALHVVSWHLIR